MSSLERERMEKEEKEEKEDALSEHAIPRDTALANVNKRLTLSESSKS
jgi:hypothetical protein